MKVNSAISIFVGIVLGFGALGLAFYFHETHPETSPYIRGAELAHEAGCYTCHGTSVDDPRVNFRLRDSAWRSTEIATMWEEEHSASSMRTWVTHGVPERKRQSHQQLLLQMPAYGDDGHLSPDEIEDVVAWALIVGLRGFQGYDNREEDMPELSVADVAELEEAELFMLGDRLSRQQGCYQCHGELGQGGPGNLASFKGYIPGFQGTDFLDLTNNGDPAEIRHWIEHGRGKAIESGLLGGLAAGYFDRQAIPMPGYRELLSDAEIELLVAYLQWLNTRGPLSGEDVEALAKSLDESI